MFLVTDPGSYGELEPPDICWMGTNGTQSVRFLVALQGNFSIQVLDGTTRDGAQLDLLVTGRTAWTLPRCVWIIIGSFLNSEHEIMWFKILWGVRKDSSSMLTRDVRKTDLGLSRKTIEWDPMGGISEELRSSGNWQVFKDISLHPNTQEKSRHIRKLAWLTWELLMELQCKKAAYGGGRNIAQECRDGVGKAKAQLELRLARNIKGKKKEVLLLH
ncbi:hypothetical protein GRJ2_000033000 [Grus japonensis]|uniref:Uncharacterized protein n=1 Tax=Grus japonensis TaxID=30415 RepID=A0ABC9VSD2_GRUJA